MSGFWYGMFVLSGVWAIVAATCCAPDFFSLAAALVATWAAREYLRMGDDARYFW